MNEESSDSIASGSGSVSASGSKRKRTESQSAQQIPASPPRYVSLDEVMKAANNLRDMSLMHQILDDDFKLDDRTSSEPALRPPIGPGTNALCAKKTPEKVLRDQVKDIASKAFWDVVRKNFNKDPPDYVQGLVLLEDIKQALFFLLILPHHSRLREEIDEKLDAVLVKQQAENNTLDFQSYASYIITVMGKLCSPARDENIRQLAQLSDLADIFRGILETLDLMKIDMTNFMIGVTRPELLTQSIDWERKKFAEVLAVKPDNLNWTKEWLRKAIEARRDQSRPLDLRRIVPEILSESYLDLLEWPENRYDQYPETLVFDREKLWKLKLQFYKITITGTILLLISNVINCELKALMELKDRLRQEIQIILEDSTNINEINATVRTISEHAVKELTVKLAELGQKPLTDEFIGLIKGQINEVIAEDHKIRLLVAKRLREFFMQILTTISTAPQKVPIGLSTMQQEILQTSGIFLRVVSRNRKVYCDYYFDIIEKSLMLELQNQHDSNNDPATATVVVAAKTVAADKVGVCESGSTTE